MKLHRLYIGSKNYLTVALLSDCSISGENDLKESKNSSGKVP